MFPAPGKPGRGQRKTQKQQPDSSGSGRDAQCSAKAGTARNTILGMGAVFFAQTIVSATRTRCA